MSDPRPRGSPLPWLLTLVLAMQVTGCTAGRIVPVGTWQSAGPQLKAVALAPDGGVFADLIGMTLAEHGFIIIDTGATAALLVLTQQRAADLLQPQGFGMLRARGVDAVLVIDRVDAGDGLPQTVHVRLHSTETKGEIGGIDWKNSWIRRGVLEAAQEIAKAVAEASNPTNGRLQGEPDIAPPTNSGQRPAGPVEIQINDAFQSK